MLECSSKSDGFNLESRWQFQAAWARGKWSTKSSMSFQRPNYLWYYSKEKRTHIFQLLLYSNMPKCKNTRMCVGISRVHILNFICAQCYYHTLAIYHANQTCRSTLRIFGFYVWMCVSMCVHTHAWISASFECVTHKIFPRLTIYALFKNLFVIEIFRFSHVVIILYLHKKTPY